jgi:nitric oxide reductase subunit B
LWYARSEEFMQQDLLETLRWIRTFGDVVFIIGALAVAWQVVKEVFDNKSAIQQPMATLTSNNNCCGQCDNGK